MFFLAIRFLVELVAVGALGFWGFASFEGAWRLAAGIGAPVALVVVWALVIAPAADNPIPGRIRELLGTLLLVGAAGALAAAGRPELGAVLAAVVVADQVALLVLDPTIAPLAAHDAR